MKKYQIKPSQQNFKSAWQPILGLSGVIILCLLVGLGKVLVSIFPLGSLAVGLFLYRHSPILYIEN